MDENPYKSPESDGGKGRPTWKVFLGISLFVAFVPVILYAALCAYVAINGYLLGHGIGYFFLPAFLAVVTVGAAGLLLIAAYRTFR